MTSPKETHLTESPLTVRSHVGRDILQSARDFKAPEDALWEYIVNSLQYVDAGISPQVSIVTNRAAHTVSVVDNGAGMDGDDLTAFFTMHGENRERLRGRAGRGKFGTGKSAAFGIGTSMTVDTVKNGVRNVVRLTAAGIAAAGDGEVPVEHILADEPVTRSNGTTITIGGLSKQVNDKAVRRFISRRLTEFRHVTPQVSLDGVVIDAWQVEIRDERTFTPPSPALVAVLGELALTVKVAAHPLDADERGVFVTAGPGNLVARFDAGVTAKDWGAYLIGDVDCPALEEPIEAGQQAAYSSSRDLQLNASHPVAAALMGYIGWALEQVRTDLVETSKQAKKTEEARRLRSTADEISRVLNADFQEQAERLEATTGNTQRRTTTPAHAGPDAVDEQNPTYKVTDGDGTPGEGSGVLADSPETPTPTDPKPGSTPTGDQPPGGDNSSEAGTPDVDGRSKVAPTPGAGQKRPRGGIEVVYEHLEGGPDGYRSQYDAERSRIVINLDHPAIEAAASLDGGVDGVAFKRLSYEVAFSEYALAVARMEVARNPELDATDAMFEVRETLRRVGAASVGLYS